MLNLIRMNLYRMVHTGSLKVVWVIMFGFVILNTYMIFRETDIYTDAEIEQMRQSQSDGFTVSEEDGVQVEFGINVSPIVTEEGVDTSALGFLVSDMSSGITLIFMVIATALFFTGEEKNGFVKNIAGQTRHKANIYFSKLFVMVLYLMASFVLWFLACVLGSMLFNGKVSLAQEPLSDYMAVLGVLVLLHIAFMSGIALLATVTGSNAMSISAGLLLASGMSRMLAKLVYMVVKCDIIKYIVMGNMGAVSVQSSERTFYRAAVVGIVWMIVYNMAGSAWFTKRDVV